MPALVQSDTRLLLKSSPDPATSRMATDTALVKSLTEVLNASLDLAAEPPRDRASLALGLSRKALAISDVAASGWDAEDLAQANFVTFQALKSVGMIKLASMTPAKATAYVTLTMAEKIVAAAGIANANKCKVALASLSVTIGTGALGCFATGALTVGIPCVVGAITIAADAFDTYGQCRVRPGSGGAGP